MNRPRFFQQSAAFSTLTCLEFAPWQTLAAVAREVDDFVRGPAVKDHPLRQVAPHVWMIFSPDGFPTPENQGMMCNITFVDTAQGLVVVDTGASVQIGEMAIRQIRKTFKKPIIAVINTTALIDFRGEPSTHARFADGEKIKLFPVVAFYGRDGKRLAAPIVGTRLPDFYQSYLDDAIEQSIAALRGR